MATDTINEQTLREVERLFASFGEYYTRIFAHGAVFGAVVALLGVFIFQMSFSACSWLMNRRKAKSL